MTAARVCPQCGQPLPSDGPQGLCPACLLKAALPGQSIPESEATAVHDSSTAAALTPEAGARLKYFGDYELLEEIARGGMGVVWKARQTSLHREVALKMIRAGALASPDEVERFLREAEAAANLQHPNIVAIHEVGEHGGQHYFSMDYVAGRDLGALVKDGPLAPQRAARYVKIIAEAIHFAHQRGTLHRDLKPQNVLIDGADQPRITDFGLAKITKDDSRLTQSGVVMGSPSYMPPEQAAGRQGDIGPASDVYAMGAMLYELLTGRPPFRGATALATLREVMESEPAAPRRLQAAIPPDLETICLKCLEKTPSARYATARALAEELDRFLKGEPIIARPASAVHKVVSWARRHPGRLAVAAALVMVALAFGVFYLFEENAFLRAQQADPSLARIPGPLYDSLGMWSFFCFLASIAGFFLLGVIEARARGLSLKEFGDRAKQRRQLQPVDDRPLQRFIGVLIGVGVRRQLQPVDDRPLQPLGERIRVFAIGAGLVLIGCGVMCLATAIQAHVWEGESPLPQYAILYTYPPICIVIFLGLATLGMVIRDYRLVHYGMLSASSRLLTAEQIEPIRRALEHDDQVGAIKRYREAVPDAVLGEANQYVIRFLESLRAQYPGKFLPPAFSLATLNRKAMLKCGLIEAVFLWMFWLAWPPAYPVSAVSQFAYSFLIGMGVNACTRVKGLWKRMLLLVPGLALLILSEVFVPRLTEGSSHALAHYWVGFYFGVQLMVSGFKPQRGEGDSTP